MECRLLADMDSKLSMTLESEARMRGVSLCDGCSYDVSQCAKSKVIHIDGILYTLVPNSKEEIKKYTTSTWCKQCKVTSAKPIALINVGYKQHIVMRCNKCKSTYTMSLEKYKVEYAGFRNMRGDFIPPRSKGGMPDSLKRKYESERKKKAIEFMERFGISEAQYNEMKKRQAERDAEFHREMAKEREEYLYKAQTKDIENESRTRKELIEAGVLKFDKATRSLYDTRTGKVVSKI